MGLGFRVQFELLVARFRNLGIACKFRTRVENSRAGAWGSGLEIFDFRL